MVGRCGQAMHDIRGNEFLDGRKSVFQHDGGNVALLLVPRDKPNGYSAANALPVDNNLGASKLVSLADVVQARLRVDHEALFVGVARRQAVAAILQHEHIAAQVLFEDPGDGQSVANVARVAVEHEHRHVARMLLVGADEEGAERLAVGRGDEEFLKVGDAKLRRAWHVGARIGREAARVDDFVLLEVEEAAEERSHAGRRNERQAQIGHEGIERRGHGGRRAAGGDWIEAAGAGSCWPWQGEATAAGSAPERSAKARGGAAYSRCLQQPPCAAALQFTHHRPAALPRNPHTRPAARLHQHTHTRPARPRP